MAVPVLAPISVARRSDNQSLLDKFDSRRSEELVIAFAGPIGSGIAAVINVAEAALQEIGYQDIVRVKLSKFLDEAVQDGRVEGYTSQAKDSSIYSRYRRLQSAGMNLREKTQNQAILAEYAIQHIVLDRETKHTTTGGEGAATPKRTAYLIDQVKRPVEVVLLRALYRNLFYLVGVTKTFEERQEFLQQEGVKVEELPDLIAIDRNEAAPSGQKLDRTLQLADYFVRNDAGSTKRDSIDRFLRLIHGDKKITPTRIENGMYAAFAAGLRSACLSRQVGAAITSSAGDVLATGRNDVPKAGGGLYAEGEELDLRCVHMPGSAAEMANGGGPNDAQSAGRDYCGYRGNRLLGLFGQRGRELCVGRMRLQRLRGNLPAGGWGAGSRVALRPLP